MPLANQVGRGLPCRRDVVEPEVEEVLIGYVAVDEKGRDAQRFDALVQRLPVDAENDQGIDVPA